MQVEGGWGFVLGSVARTFWGTGGGNTCAGDVTMSCNVGAGTGGGCDGILDRKCGTVTSGATWRRTVLNRCECETFAAFAIGVEYFAALSISGSEAGDANDDRRRRSDWNVIVDMSTPNRECEDVIW
jgi:hypothetical protein